MKPLVASSANALPAIAFRPEPGLVVCDLDLVREADPEDLKLGYVILVGTMLSSSKSRWNQFTETVPEILADEEVALRQCRSVVSDCSQGRTDGHEPERPPCTRFWQNGGAYPARLLG